jgi:hypothetical protein
VQQHVQQTREFITSVHVVMTQEQWLLRNMFQIQHLDTTLHQAQESTFSDMKVVVIVITINTIHVLVVEHTTQTHLSQQTTVIQTGLARTKLTRLVKNVTIVVTHINR